MLKDIAVRLKTPILEVEGTWEPNDTERKAAWEIYVELCTRTGIAAIPIEYGSDREILQSLLSLFEMHRSILRKYGPAVAEPKKDGSYNLGILTMITLNQVLRPFLTRWHTLLSREESRQIGEGRVLTDFEHEWSAHDEFRSDLAAIQSTLRQYANLLSFACGVPDLLRHV